jgi:acetyl-CoA acyltransferase
MVEAVIIDAVRTAVGRGKPDAGWLSQIHPADLLAEAMVGLMSRTGVDPALIEDAVMGTAAQIGPQTANIARTAVLSAGFPLSVPGVTLDRACGSSQQAVHFAAQGILSGTQDVVLAGGVESMSWVPIGSGAAGRSPYGAKYYERFPQDKPHSQGIAAEMVAVKWGVTRQDADEYSVRSHELAHAATEAGLLAKEIIPIKAPQADGSVMEVTTDQGIRPGTTTEILAGLRPAFWVPDYPDELPWLVTAGNSSQISDAASVALLMSDTKAADLGLTPRARIHSLGLAGDDPIMMLTGIIPATRAALARAGMTVDDIDVFEVNEAFASVVLAFQREFDIPLEKINVHGGAISIGHPIGASGTRLFSSLLNALEAKDGQFGLQVMCEAGGLSNATIVERRR